ncbi:MAG: hypothetical protein KAY32_17505, partial [Candidatus Eisenbacteria sp.]|nr:hypothetical protein [Candidatus Eisenbacteria bacterium]
MENKTNFQQDPQGQWQQPPQGPQGPYYGTPWGYQGPWGWWSQQTPTEPKPHDEQNEETNKTDPNQRPGYAYTNQQGTPFVSNPAWQQMPPFGWVNMNRPTGSWWNQDQSNAWQYQNYPWM